VFPSALVLTRRATKMPGAVRDPGDELPPLPVSAARAVSILSVVERLGLGDPVRQGREYFIRCPLHDDQHPSLRMNADSGLWPCDPCARGGDAIDLYERVRGIGFVDAVRELAGVR
jgi:hypothetical protein